MGEPEEDEEKAEEHEVEVEDDWRTEIIEAEI